MAATSAQDAVRAVVEPAVAATGLFLETVQVTQAGRRSVLRVVVDLPEDQVGGLSSDALETASRNVSQALDSSDVMGQAPYVLEVTSPGIDRPLTERRHWLRARRRLVLVTLADGRQVEGRLGDVGDPGIVLDGEALAWEQVARGRMQVDFKGLEDDDLLDGTLDGEGED